MKKTQLARLIAALLGGGAASLAQAGAFQLYEQNASGVGNAFAGSAASAEDASAAYFNPASMVFMANPRQASIGVDIVKPTAKFENRASSAAYGVSADKFGDNGGDAGPVAFAPAVHLAYALNKDFSIGLSAGAPFGLKTEYDSGWVGRYQAIKSDIKTENLNPSIAWRVNEKIAIGGGLNYQHFSAVLSQAVNFSAAMCAKASVSALCGAGLLKDYEGSSEVSGSSNAWGWNFGVAAQLSEKTRVGVSYRSAIRHSVSGVVDFTHPTVSLPTSVTGGAQIATSLNAGIRSLTQNGPVTVDIKLPETWIVSAFQQLDDRWSLAADASLTGWSSLRSLDIYRSNGTLLSSSYYNWKDTWRIALGGAYQYNDTLKLRAGLGFDQSPIRSDYRTPRLPDTDRTWISLGFNYKLSPRFSVDTGYTHIFMKKTSISESGYHPDYNPNGINTTNAVSRGTLVGEYTGSVDILGLQLNLLF